MCIDLFLQKSSSFQKETELYGATWWYISEFPVSGVSCDQTIEGITPLPNSVGQMTNITLLFIFELVWIVFEIVLELVFELLLQLVFGSVFKLVFKYVFELVFELALWLNEHHD